MVSLELKGKRRSARGRGLLLASLSAAALTLSGCGAIGADSDSGSGDGPIEIGFGTQLSGPAGAYGPSTVQAAEAAVAEINDSGGLLGRDVELVVRDDATDVTVGARNARELIDGRKVPLMVSMESSAVRQAIAPLVADADVVYFYAPIYEGGACEANTYAVGEVPQQYGPAFDQLIDGASKSDWYAVGDDYEWPQKTNELAEESIEAAGGSLVGTSLVPLGTQDYSSIISKIKSEQPEWILNTLVGGDSQAFIKQWREFGLSETIQMLTLGTTDDLIASLGADADGIYAVLGYAQGIDSPANKAFLEATARAAGGSGDEVAIQQTLSENVYTSIMLWAEAVRTADSVAPKDVRAALDSGEITVDAPRGQVTMDGTNHHVSQHMYLFQAADGKLEVESDFGVLAPGEQCNLQPES